MPEQRTVETGRARALARRGRAEAGDGRAPGGTVSWLVLAVILSATFMNAFDFFSVNVAEPSLQRDLGTGPAALELIVGGFGLTFSLGLVTGGRLGDRFGRRRVFRIGMVAFAASSAASAAAPTSAVLVGFRLLQGAAAAVLIPQVLAFIRESFEPVQQRRALSRYGMTIAVGQLAGQVVGGGLLTLDLFGWSWRPILLVNVVVALVALTAGAGRLPESRAEHPPTFDPRGAAVLTVVAALFVVPLVFGRPLGWPWWCFACLAAVAPGAAWLVRVERRAQGRIEPILDLALFRSRVFVAGMVVNVSLFATIASFFFLFSLYLQDGRHDAPLAAALMFVPLAAGNFVASSSSARLVARFGHHVLFAGAVAQAVGLGLLVVVTLLSGPTGHVAMVAVAAAVFGVGQGLLIPTIIGVVIARVRATVSGAAAGMLVMTQQLAGTIGLLVVSEVFFSGLGAGEGPAAYVAAFRRALVCDLCFTAATLLTSRWLHGVATRAGRQPKLALEPVPVVPAGAVEGALGEAALRITDLEAANPAEGEAPGSS